MNPLPANFHVCSFSGNNGLRITRPDGIGYDSYCLLEKNSVALPLHLRKVYLEKDLLSRDLCQDIINKAEAYALDQVDDQGNDGWTTNRHIAYPTTDIPVESIFGTLSSLHAYVDCHLLPHIAKNFNLNEENLHIGELFVAKYQHEDSSDKKEPQTGLPAHVDGTPYSFVAALNDGTEYENGGTSFTRRHPSQEQKVWKCDKAGSVIFFSGKNEHKGVAITSGVRYILTGFINYTNKRDLSHSTFMNDYNPLFDGTAARGGVQSGDILRGVYSNGEMINVDKDMHTEDIQSLFRSSKESDDVVTVLVERHPEDAVCEEAILTQGILRRKHVLLSTQNYFAVDFFTRKGLSV